MSDDRLVRTFSVGRPRRQELEELGDLFLSNAPAPTAPNEPTDAAGVDDLLSRARTANQLLEQFADNDARNVQLVAILAGALPAAARDPVAWAVARRLVAADAPDATPVVRIEGHRATVSSLGGLPISVHALGRQAAASGLAIMIVAEQAASYLDTGRRLPEHCVVPVTDDRESLIEAYRELKVATAATSGPAPEIAVVGTGSGVHAEQTYRRLARVAIAHLACTPVFAGAILEPVGPADRNTSDTEADATTVYRLLDRMMAKAEARPTTEAADTVAPTVEVPPAEPAAGQRETLPPVAAVVTPRETAPTAAATFALWEPQSPEEVLEAAAACLTGLVAGARGVVNLDGLIDDPATGDLLVADATGQPVAVVLANEDTAGALRRAVACRSWLATYGRLVARAVPQAGLSPEADGGRAIVLIRDDQADDFEALCPPNTDLVAWTPVALGTQRGLLFRQVLWSVDGPPPEAPEPPPAPPVVTLPETMDVPRRSVGETSDEEADVGSSPDDDLSADEINDLSGAFDIDELT